MPILYYIILDYTMLLCDTILYYTRSLWCLCFCRLLDLAVGPRSVLRAALPIVGGVVGVFQGHLPASGPQSFSAEVVSGMQNTWTHVDGCQNFGRFLGPHIRCRIILRTPKGAIILIATHVE